MWARFGGLAHEDVIMYHKKEEHKWKRKNLLKHLHSVIRNANVDVISLNLIDDEHVEITYKGGGKRKVNIACDSYKSIMIDVLKYCE